MYKSIFKFSIEKSIVKSMPFLEPICSITLVRNRVISHTLRNPLLFPATMIFDP